MGSLPNGTAILLSREAVKALLTCQACMARDAGISLSFYSSNLGPRCTKWRPIGDGGGRLGEVCVTWNSLGKMYTTFLLYKKFQFIKRKLGMRTDKSQAINSASFLFCTIVLSIWCGPEIAFRSGFEQTLAVLKQLSNVTFYTRLEMAFSSQWISNYQYRSQVPAGQGTSKARSPSVPCLEPEQSLRLDPWKWSHFVPITSSHWCALFKRPSDSHLYWKLFSKAVNQRVEWRHYWFNRIAG